MYKQTPIGKIPENWDVVRLGDISKNILTGATPLRSNKSFWENGEIPWLTNEEVKEGKINYIYDTKEKVTKLSLKKTNIKLIPPNSLILSLTASVGKVAINKIPITTNQQFNSFILDTEKVHPEFLAYYFIFAKKRVELLDGLTTFKFISKSMIANFQVPLPPLKEQKKIAEILSTVDKAIEKVDEEIEKTQRLKKGLMQELLTKGIGHKEFKDTEIGRIPEEWKVVRLGDIAKLESGGTPSRKKSEYWKNGTIPWVKSGELNDGIIYNTEEKITERGLKNSSAKIFPKGTLLIALYGKGTVSKTAILGIDATTNQAVAAIIPINSAFDPKFMQYYLIYSRNKLLSHLVNPSSDVGRTNIYLSSLKLFKVSLPPLPEQQKIAEILSTVDKKLEFLRKRKEKLERIKKGLMNDLLTGRKRVKVN